MSRVAVSSEGAVTAVTARKSILQGYTPSQLMFRLMEDFSNMTNDAIRIGLNNDIWTLKRLSLLVYRELTSRYENVPSYYRLCAISKASGVLSTRKKSMKRGFHTREPRLRRPCLTSCYGFRIRDGHLLVPLGKHAIERIPLTRHTLSVLRSEPNLVVRSFNLAESSLSPCIAKEVLPMGAGGVSGAVGVDRNLRNVTVGDDERAIFYDVTKIVKIADTTTAIVRSVKRNDVRIRRRVCSKYGNRRTEKTGQILHRVSKQIVQDAKTKNQVIVFEEIEGIRKLYRKGNGQGVRSRRTMNSWPFFELKRQVEYKAAWEGVPVITLTRGETKGTTMDCARCGERLQEPVRGDEQHRRQLWCDVCERWFDRDVVAVMNISRRGLLRFGSSKWKGEAGEAVKRNPEGKTQQVILRVDASKSPLTKR